MSLFDKLKGLFRRAPSARSSSNGARRLDDVEMISCEEALRQVQEYLDGELEQVPAAQVKRHFEVCARCYPHVDFEQAYRDAVRRAMAGEAAPPELRAKISALIAEAASE